MNYITRLYLKITQSVLTTQSVSLVVCMGVLAVAFFIIGTVTTDHRVETWTSLLSGFAFGVFLVCLPALINYLKRNKQEAVK